jgi:hypothetical protein
MLYDLILIWPTGIPYISTNLSLLPLTNFLGLRVPKCRKAQVPVLPTKARKCPKPVEILAVMTLHQYKSLTLTTRKCGKQGYMSASFADKSGLMTPT